MLRGRRFTVRGRVQGVWFRDSTRREAIALGLTGSAVNLPNGDVEVHAYGEASSLEILEQWLRRGPPLAEVTELLAGAEEWRDVVGFAVR